MMTRERVVQLDMLPATEPEITPAAESFEAAALARLLRRLYCIMYRQTKPSAATYGDTPLPRYDGGTDSSGRRYKAVWPDMAAFVTTHNLDPFVLVRRGFATYRVKWQPPTPQQLMSSAVLIEYRRYKAGIVDDLRSLWDRSCLDFEASRRILLATCPTMSLEGAVINAMVANPDIHGDAAVFRFCLADILQCSAAVELYHDKALYAYAWQKHDYDVAWGMHIPASLRDEAAAYRRSLSS